MSGHHDISEYIDSISFKKKFGYGVSTDQVYDVICNLSSMYNSVLEESYREVEELKAEITVLKRTGTKAVVEQKEDSTVEIITEQKKEEEKKAMAKNSNKDLSKLNRRELLEILVAQSQENDELRQLVEQLVEEKRELNEKLRDRKIKIEKAGTLAEATFMINGVLESAQVAAQQYLDNLQDLYDREEINCTEKEKATESRCAAMTVVAQERCDIMKRDTEAQCKAMEEETQKKCEEMMRDTEAQCASLTKKAQDEAEAHWQQLTEKLETFYSAHAGLKEILSATDQRLRNEE